MKKESDIESGHGVNADDGPGGVSRIELIKDKVNQFAARNGRRPRVLVGHVGSSGQRRTLNQVAAIFARLGFDVDIGSIGQSPQQVALTAIENDVHMVCLLCDPERQSQMASDLIDALRGNHSEDILLASFGDAPTSDKCSRAAGARFGPVRIRSARAEVDIISILDKLYKQNR